MLTFFHGIGINFIPIPCIFVKKTKHICFNTIVLNVIEYCIFKNGVYNCITRSTHVKESV